MYNKMSVAAPTVLETDTSSFQALGMEIKRNSLVLSQPSSIFLSVYKEVGAILQVGLLSWVVMAILMLWT